MKALVKHDKGVDGIGLVDVDVPEISADDVLVEVKAAAICGTDLHIMKDKYPVAMPVIIGHEFSGVIEKVGQNVKCWRKGDRVIAEGNIETCGSCFLCLGGNANLCKDRKYLGIMVNGVFARYVRIPARLLFRIPEKLSFDEAALAEPAAVAIDALLEKNRVQIGDFVAVLGCGPIGLLAGQIAKAAGAGKVLITGRGSAVKSRFKVAEDLGVFDYILNTEKDDPVKVVNEATGGRGADIIIDTTGNAQAILQAFEMVRRMGVIEVVGLGAEAIPVPWGRMMSEVVNIRFCRGTSYHSFRKFCALAAMGKLKLQPMISNKFSLEAWKEGFKSVENRESVKTLLIP